MVKGVQGLFSIRWPRRLDSKIGFLALNPVNRLQSPQTNLPRTKPLAFLFLQNGKKKVCNQHSAILLTNRIRGVTKGFEQDN